MNVTRLRRLATGRRLTREAFSLAAVAVVFVVVVPRIASYGPVAHELGSLSAVWIGGLASATALNVLTFALPWRPLLPGLSLPRTLAFTQASTAVVMVVPGGAPLGLGVSFGLLRRIGVTRRAAAAAVALTGLWNQVAIFSFPIFGVLAVVTARPVSTAVLAAACVSSGLALATVAIVVVVFVSDAGSERIGAPVERVLAVTSHLTGKHARPGRSGAVAAFREEPRRLLRRHWPLLTITTLANQLTGYLLLALCLRATGPTSLSAASVFLAWSLGRVLGSLPLTPGGIGVVELGLIGLLASLGAAHTHAVAAVLLYRGLIVVPTLALGLATLLVWRLRPSRSAD